MYKDLRDWLTEVEKLGQLKRVNGAHWDVEMGALMQLVAEKYSDKAPALLFDEVPGYPKGYRNLYGHFNTVERVALTLGMPQGLGKVGLVAAYQKKMASLKPIPFEYVSDGPILENVHTGDDVNVMEFPVPQHHMRDNGRYIGTACEVLTQDPDEGWFNLGTYRSRAYDAKTVGCQITEGKHGRIHRDKMFERGLPMKVVIIVGQDPLLYMLGASPVPNGVSEYDIYGAIKGEPMQVVKGPFTGYPIPANAEIVIEGETTKGDVLEEGPFGEWTGYYCSKPENRACVRVKSILHRNDPIICNAPQHRPVDETVLLKAVTGSASIWEALRLVDIPDIRGVWQHEGGGGVRFTVVSIKQRYPGHARQVLHVAAECQAGAYNGKWTVVVDDDIDPSNINQVLWAMSTRFDPVEDIDLIRKAWASTRDPMVLPHTGNTNNRILVDACIPFHRMQKGEFPPVVEVSPELTKTLIAKWQGILF